MMVNEECQNVCNKALEPSDILNFQWLIQRDYQYTFMVDNLPSAFLSRNDTTATIKYENGIPIGTYDAVK